MGQRGCIGRRKNKWQECLPDVRMGVWGSERTWTMIEFDVKIEAGDLYNYMMAHAYGSASGLIGSCFGALMIVIFGMDPRQWIFLVCGVILLLYLPVTLWMKSKQLALTNPSFQKPLHYVLDEEGISVSQGETTEDKPGRICTRPRPRAGASSSTLPRSARPYFPTGIWGNREHR